MKIIQKKQLIERWRAEGISSQVLQAFARVKREQFVPKEFVHDAYADQPLPIGHNQTISQPTTVVRMLDALGVREGMKVLDVGAGSGYTAALLSVLVGNKGRVFAVEVIADLAEMLKSRFAGVKNVVVVHGDGSKGLPAHAPFDCILVSAASPSIPQALTGQLKIGGILVIPVGLLAHQRLLRVQKTSANKLVQEDLGDYVFVPLM